MVTSNENPTWAEGVPDPATWRAPPGRSIAEARQEQDEAAGGVENRTVRLPGDKSPRGSIALKGLGRRVYAYLRFQSDGRTVTRYVGEAFGSTRAERLESAWRTALDRGLVGPPPK